MFNSFGQFAATTQFYLYGKSRCTQTGWEKAHRNYPKPDLLEDPSLDISDRVYIVTGANAGIGREITTYLATKQATVYMICRNPERAAKARDAIVAQSSNEKVHLLLGDCGLESDIRRMYDEFVHTQRTVYAEQAFSLRLDGLVCNAGALLNHKTLTDEGIEVTFATHLLFGTFLLTELCLPLLQATPHSRVIAVSSGGMYNTAFPAWEVATSTGPAGDSYDGQFAYAYAKRAQVLLCEKWAEMYDNVTFVSCHPGWTQTEALDAAYGDNKSYLEPLRNTWQGAEGIIWLCVVPNTQLQSGAFYLDRSPQVKHIAGPFFTEGSYTKNTRAEVDDMYQRLQRWSSSATRPSPAEIQLEAARKLPLTAMTTPIDLQAFMGTWYVLAHIPTYPEVGTANGIEHYAYDSARDRIKVTFSYVGKGASTASSMQMRATVLNAPINTHWAIDPKVFGVRVPLKMDYLTLGLSSAHGGSDAQWTLVGVPDRAYLWLMTRTKPVFYEEYTAALDVYKISDAQLETAARRANRRASKTSSSTAASVARADEVEDEEAEADVRRSDQFASVDLTSSSITPQQHLQERRVVLEALSLARDLGYDVRRVMRVPWIALPGDKSDGAGSGGK